MRIGERYRCRGEELFSGVWTIVAYCNEESVSVLQSEDGSLKMMVPYAEFARLEEVQDE